MPKYVVLYQLTDQGMKNICSTVERARENKHQSEQRGFHILDIYWTLGRYDVVVVLEAPDELTMMAGLLNIAGAGNARCETLRAFTAQEMEQVLQKM
jgi:uncharacterized protein with GYD domain